MESQGLSCNHENSYFHCVQVCARSPQTAVYDSQYLHLHLVIIKEGQEFTKTSTTKVVMEAQEEIHPSDAWGLAHCLQRRTAF